MCETISKGKNIYLRKDGRWEGRYVKGRKNNGRLKYGYVYGKSYEEVNRKLIPLRQASEKMVLLYGKSLMNYEEWINEWKMEVKGTIKASTFSDYNYKINKYLIPFLGHFSLYQLNIDTIHELITHLQEDDLSPSSIKVIARLLSQTLRRALQKGLITRNPCEGVQLPKSTPKKVRALTLEQQQALVKAVNTMNNDKGQAVILGLNTGMRIGEIAALTWKNIDFQQEIIHVTQTCHRLAIETNGKSCLYYDAVKSLASHRIIPMNQSTKEILLKLKKSSVSPFVFSVGEKGCEPRLLTYHFHKIRKLAKVEGIHFHQLRHTFATRCLEANISVPSVSALLGHSSTKMTLDVYSDSMLKERVLAVHAIEKIA
ncbi:tyrosine-type recombinase/integrase [Enterococcus sp. DIV0187]|uniref:tyrosine-type recombinase/integrase n=1 Tax=Enterococcus sp. DIV0187 TaxID=2774644 RepID=UPI003F28F33F